MGTGYRPRVMPRPECLTYLIVISLSKTIVCNVKDPPLLTDENKTLQEKQNLL